MPDLALSNEMHRRVTSASEVTRTEHGSARLLRLTLHRHEPHGRPLRCLADRLGIRGIVLLSLDERLYVGRRNEPHLMAEALQLATPMMRSSARLHRDSAVRM